MYKTTRLGTEKVALAIGKAMMGRRTLGSASSFVSSELAKMGWMDVRSKAEVKEAADSLARKCLLAKKEAVLRAIAYGMDDLIKAFNRAYKRTWTRTKKLGTMTKMKMMRGMKEPVVFYLVSSHQKPQPAHADLQGELLVDYYWKSTMEAAGLDTETVGRYIHNKRIRTVQWAMGAPHYLIVRPNCKHRLLPVRTRYVLSHPLSAIRKLEQPRETGVKRPITDHKRWEEYKELRGTVLAKLQKMLGKPMRLGQG